MTSLLSVFKLLLYRSLYTYFRLYFGQKKNTFLLDFGGHKLLLVSSAYLLLSVSKSQKCQTVTIENDGEFS